MPARVPPSLGRLVPPGDADALAHAIQTVWADADAMGHAARAHVEARYGWSRTFERLLGIYDEALSVRATAS